jgi:hypothetical protein
MSVATVLHPTPVLVLVRLVLLPATLMRERVARKHDPKHGMIVRMSSVILIEYPVHLSVPSLLQGLPASNLHWVLVSRSPRHLSTLRCLVRHV